MVLYTVIWNPPSLALAQKPTLSIYHAFAGKRVRIKLLSWSGAPTFNGTKTTNIFDPIRIEFSDGFQANGMGVIASQNALDVAYIYPNCFYVDPIVGYADDPADVSPDREVVRCIRFNKEPEIQGVMVGNLITLQLSVSAVAINELPDSSLFSYVRNQFFYYKAEFDIEEI